MDKVLKRVTHHKKQTSNSNIKSADNSCGFPQSSINKRYSVDDNFYTYFYKGESHQNCNGNNYYTISNREDFKRNTARQYRSPRQPELGHERQLPREDATFKKFLKVFNTGENSRTAKDWFTLNATNVMDFAPKILTKRFCGKKSDNELYRSNSFKFERFERVDSDTLSSSKKSSVSKQISLCDDYSLPVDFVNKRPLSLDSGSFWSAQSPNCDRVKVLNLYCDPKDSKSQPNLTDEPCAIESEVQDEKLRSNVAAEKIYHSYDDASDDGEDEDDEPELYENLKRRKSIGRFAHSQWANKNNTYTEVRKSPYYYGDLLKKGDKGEHLSQQRRHEFQSQHKRPNPVVTNDKPEPIYSNDIKFFDANVNSFYIEEEIGEEDSMGSRQRQMYETAFDSKTYHSREATQLDAMTNQPSSPQFPHSPAFCGTLEDQKCGLKRLMPVKDKRNNFESSMDSLSQHFTDFDIAGQNTLLLSYSSASTSTIPLPQSVSSHLNDSFDSLSESPPKANRSRANNNLLDDQCKPIKDVQSNINNNKESKRKNINKFSVRHQHHQKNKSLQCYYNNDNNGVLSNDNNTRSKSRHPPSKILEIKSRPRERSSAKSSSTESMMTSSSGGSLESIKSSTSEGNRSTTSTDSHRSSSLSSHSSDSAVGNGGFPFSINFPLGNRFLNQTKIHVLSPISDKSFQELPSESSDVSELNRNCSSQKASPEELKCAAVSLEEEQKRSDNVHKTKRRPLPNKNVASLNNSCSSGDAEGHLCSDSGISMESASDKAKLPQNNDFNDLPFDMPKLRRRRLQQIQSLQNSTQDTSSSATSVDLKDLPFDMPKLRRKLRSSSTQESVESPLYTNNTATSAPEGDQLGNAINEQASSQDQGRNRKSLGLSLNLNKVFPAEYGIDTNLPLERQGWYHGAITRMEAENELRSKDEGSYLVRNSESAKNDYSLSLKSAKGFMHMRIQKSSETNKFILGQFSSPFDSIPEMIKHYSSNQLPIRGAEHMCLLQPVIAQFL